MPRTTEDLVKGVLTRDYDTRNSPSLEPFIEAASAIIDRTAACAARRGVTLSSAEQELLERWVAAHAYHCTDPTYSERATLSARGKFMGQGGMGLEGSRYGQFALSLDPSGCLSVMSRPRYAGVRWVGKRVSEQIPADQRE